MTRSPLVTIGLAMIVAGVVALVAGSAVASHDLIVGLILLLLIPLSISACGSVVALIGLVRQRDDRRRASLVRTIIGVAALVGAAFGFGYPALGTLSQLPDYAAGLNGAFLAPAAPTVLLMPGAGLLVGLGLGILVALAWWAADGRHRPSTTAEPR